MKKMNCVSTMPEIMPEITDEAIIEALFAQRPYEEKVINSAFLKSFRNVLPFRKKTSGTFLPASSISFMKRMFFLSSIPSFPLSISRMRQ